MPWPKGRPRSEETKRKISEGNKGKTIDLATRRKISKALKGRPSRLKGRKIGPFSDEHRRNLSEAAKWRKRQPHSEATKRKIAASNRGQRRTEETKRKLREAARKRSPEHRRKLSEALRGRPSPMKGKQLSGEHKRKLSEAAKGKVLSEETRRKMSKVRKGRRHSEETKRKIGEAHKGRAPWHKGQTGIYSEEHKRKMSAAIRAAWRQGAYDGRDCNPAVTDYSGIQMRSTWEARLAAVFDVLGWKWEYEPCQLQYNLADGAHTYTPDFYVHDTDCFYDPHCSFWGDNEQKFDAVREQHGINLIVLPEPLLEAYERAVDVRAV